MAQFNGDPRLEIIHMEMSNSFAHFGSHVSALSRQIKQGLFFAKNGIRVRLKPLKYSATGTTAGPNVIEITPELKEKINNIIKSAGNKHD